MTSDLIESLFLKTRQPLLKLLKRRIGCPQTAEDLVQETYLRIVQQNASTDMDNPGGYVFRIAGNLAVDHQRRAAARAAARHQALDEDMVCPKSLPDTLTEIDQMLALLDALIAELPPRCRVIFLLHKIEDLSHREIAEQLNISSRTVETQIGKARKILRDRLDRL
ncbi:MAG: RNA polymerase sigma factor [Methylohalobius sp. ZOD2]